MVRLGRYPPEWAVGPGDEREVMGFAPLYTSHTLRHASRIEPVYAALAALELRIIIDVAKAT